MDLLQTTAAAWGLALSDEQLAQLSLYADELLRWNDQLNLTAVTSRDAVITRHFLDSLRCALSWGDPPASLADIGSGAGFPGLPLKILRPNLRLTLVESIEKKAQFLRHMVATLGLADVQVLAARAEAIGHDPEHRERYEAVAARAVADLRVLAEYCLPLVAPGGRLLAPKGPHGADEAALAARAIEELGGRLLAVEPVTLPGEPDRTLVVIEKVRPTPARYPRRAGVPSKRPL
jgi:16S rRNA (guanine527-N7)-methyltransferase